MKPINKVIHQPIRLNILTLLHIDKQLSFSEIKKELQLSDGNLGTHLEKLEAEKYIDIHKSFVNKKPKTTVKITSLGEQELVAYIENLEKLFSKTKQ